MPKRKDANSDNVKLAKWYADRHLETDPGVEEVHYLPANSPPREIRFLEVNKLISETGELEPIDFGVDIGNSEGHVLVVLDVTPAQWEAIQKHKLALPAGWSLDGRQTFKRATS
jgi:hypothetical protein